MSMSEIADYANFRRSFLQKRVENNAGEVFRNSAIADRHKKGSGNCKESMFAEVM